MKRNSGPNFTLTQWIILGVLAFLAVGVLCATSVVVGTNVLYPPTPTPTRYVFPPTWTPIPTQTMIVPTPRVSPTPK